MRSNAPEVTLTQLVVALGVCLIHPVGQVRRALRTLAGRHHPVEVVATVGGDLPVRG
jgi:hypothetical protein